MNFLIVWIVQLLVFFVIVSSVASLFTKSKANTNTKTHQARQAGDEVEAPKRNVPKKTQTKQNNRPVRAQREKREQYQRFDRTKPATNMIQEVVSLSSSKKGENKSTSVSFNKRNLKQAFVYKEILDKPISLREDD